MFFCTIKWEPLTKSLQNLRNTCIPLFMFRTWLDFGEILLETGFFWRIFFRNFGGVFQGQTSFWPYLRNGWSDWCETKSSSVECWVYDVTLIFDLTHDLDLGIFKVKFRNSCISVVGLIDVKCKGSELVRYWADRMTTPMTLTFKFQGRSLK